VGGTATRCGRGMSDPVADVPALRAGLDATARVAAIIHRRVPEAAGWLAQRVALAVRQAGLPALADADA
jgi:hypothetical protein